MRTKRELIDIVNQTGTVKASERKHKLFIMGIMAGMYIALGAIFFTTVTAFGGHPGAVRLIGGVVFSLGIILVVLAGAELFTGNNLMVVSLFNKKIKATQLIKNWSIVYLGNFIGSLIMVGLMFLTEQYMQNEGLIGKRVIELANLKTNLSFFAVLSRAILCNILVCLAIWLSMVAKSITGKILGIVFPISAFVAIGFEHCVANMYFIPMGVLLKNNANEHFWSMTNLSASSFENLTMSTFLIDNLLPVTFGNMIGGVFFVGYLYWLVHRENVK